VAAGVRLGSAIPLAMRAVGCSGSLARRSLRRVASTQRVAPAAYGAAVCLTSTHYNWTLNWLWPGAQDRQTAGV
jgi:hypothetical protein